jgi:hypothetical protein
MQRHTALNLLFNAVGIGLVLALAGYVINSALITEAVPSCTKTFPPATAFQLATPAGAPLTKIDLQARAGLSEWGVRENVSVVEDGPRKLALEVKLGPVEAGPKRDGSAANGVEFRWNTPPLEKASAACLSYSVFLPQDFPYGNGGSLPGFYGTETSSAGSNFAAGDRFGTRILWRADGFGQIDAEPQGGESVALNPTFSFERGRWVQFDQEIVLNKAGAADGAIRLWVDGALVVDNTALELRKSEAASLRGVLAWIGYAREPAGPPAAVRLTPFALSWR